MTIFARIADTLEADWQSIARPEQLAPEGNWSTWIYCGGRGTGKTRAGPNGCARSPKPPVCLVLLS